MIEKTRSSVCKVQRSRFKLASILKTALQMAKSAGVSRKSTRRKAEVAKESATLIKPKTQTPVQGKSDVLRQKLRLQREGKIPKSPSKLYTDFRNGPSPAVCSLVAHLRDFRGYSWDKVIEETENRLREGPPSFKALVPLDEKQAYAMYILHRHYSARRSQICKRRSRLDVASLRLYRVKKAMENLGSDASMKELIGNAFPNDAKDPSLIENEADSTAGPAIVASHDPSPSEMPVFRGPHAKKNRELYRKAIQEGERAAALASATVESVVKKEAAAAYCKRIASERGLTAYRKLPGAADAMPTELLTDDLVAVEWRAQRKRLQEEGVLKAMEKAAPLFWTEVARRMAANGIPVEAEEAQEIFNGIE